MLKQCWAGLVLVAMMVTVGCSSSVVNSNKVIESFFTNPPGTVRTIILVEDINGATIFEGKKVAVRGDSVEDAAAAICPDKKVIKIVVLVSRTEFGQPEIVYVVYLGNNN